MLIVGIGELLWDVFPDGRTVAGGAPFNFTYHCHNLGHTAVMVSAVGDDDLGRELRQRVRELGLTDEFIQTDPYHPTGTVRVTVDPAGQPSYEIIEDVAWDHIEFTPEVAALAGKCDAMCYGTLAGRKIGTPRLNGRVVNQFLTAVALSRDPDYLSKVQATIDGPIDWPSGMVPFPLQVCDLNLRHPHVHDSAVNNAWRADWLKLNTDEMRWLGDDSMGLRPPADVTPVTFARKFNNSWGPRIPPAVVIVTDGGNGVTVVNGDEVIVEPGVPANVVDTVGAGDAFTAAMVCLHLEGKPLAECVRFAVRYAAKVCEHAGGTPRIDRAAVERELSS